MTTMGPSKTTPEPGGTTPDPGVRFGPVPPALRVAAAARLVNVADTERPTAARRLVESAAAHGIDLDLLWGALSPDADRRETPRAPAQSPSATRSRAGEPVRQCVLVVPGAGRAAVVFLSRPGPTAGFGDGPTQRSELAETARAAAAGAAARFGDRLALLQALPDASESWAVSALTDAGWSSVGELAYLRRQPQKPARTPPPEPAWPAGVTVRRVAALENGPAPSPDHALLIRALDQTYTDTLDCPELCGVRAPEDVLASHRATGRFDPARWWLVFDRGEPAGCCLLNHNPPQSALELVYLGLAPSLRGRGLGAALLEHALARSTPPGTREITCAVDRRNTPALTTYTRLGFRAFASKSALVLALAPSSG